MRLFNIKYFISIYKRFILYFQTIFVNKYINFYTIYIDSIESIIPFNLHFLISFQFKKLNKHYTDNSQYHLNYHILILYE